MKNRILSNWSFSRILRVILGFVIIAEAASGANIIGAVAGAIFVGMGIFDIGCCGSGACYVPVKNIKQEKITDISYKEIN